MRQMLLKQLPKIDELLSDERVLEASQQIHRDLVVTLLRETVDQFRQMILKGVFDSEPFFPEDAFFRELEKALQQTQTTQLKPVINATGVILHTNLGRSILPASIVEQLTAIATGYSTLEYNLETGERGDRYAAVEGRLCQLTGAEAALVVNNNAAAVLLVLDTLAKHKEVIVSRGQLVEIGGSFRIPDVMSRSQTRLKEVGTTNKTHLQDYEEAISEETAALMKVHTSNFKMVGFVKTVPLEDLVALGRTHRLPVIDDLGSGSLVDVSQFGLPYEPLVMDSLKAGADIVTFSGDKLLGGPQAGIICGRKAHIDAIKKNPLTRALRVDKMTLCALEGLLKLYQQGGAALLEIPTLAMMHLRAEDIQTRAQSLVSALEKRLNGKHATPLVTLSIEPEVSEVGGGSMPGEHLKTYAIGIQPHRTSVEGFTRTLRHLPLPIIGRIKDETLWLDLRTVQPSEEEGLIQGLVSALETDGGAHA